MATTVPDRAGATPPPRRHGRWHAPIGIALGILGTLLGLLVLAWAVLFITKGRFLKSSFESYGSRFLGRQIRVAGDFELYFAPLNLKFVADGMTIANPSWASKPNFFAADHIDTRVATFSAIFGHYKARWLNLAGTTVDAEWDAAHKRNTWTFGGGKTEIPTIEHATISGTTVYYRDPKARIFADATFDTVRAEGRSIENAIRAHVTGSARGRPFKAEAALLTPNSTVAMGRTRVTASIDAAMTHIDLNGSMAAPTKLEGAQIDVGVRGRNLANLFTVAGIVVPDTRAYNIRSHFTMDGGVYTFTRLAGHFGDSDIGGRFTVSLPKGRPTIDADLRSNKLDIVDVGPFIGYNPATIAKGPVAAATTQGSASGGHPRLLPDAPLRVDALKTMDAHVVYAVRVIRAPHVPVSNISLTLDLDHNLLKLSPLTMDVAGGHLAADIALNARGAQVLTDYDIRMSPTPLGRLFAGFGMKDSGTTGTVNAHIKMTGTGDSVRKSLASSNGRIAIGLPAGTLWLSYATLSQLNLGTFAQKYFEKQLKKPVKINCGLIAFTVRDGIARADPVLIDTDENVMTAKGGFSFQDESLNLQFMSRGKKFSAFSGQSPIGFGGYFAAPSFSIVSPQLLARGGAAVALGIVATPLASVLAFVDFGTTPNTACGPVLSGATAAAQHTTKGKEVKGLGTKADNRDQAAQPKKKFLGIF